MKGVFQGVECQTGEVRISGKTEKALIYEYKPEGDDVQALAAAGFKDMDNGLWVRKLTMDEYRKIIIEFEQLEKQAVRQRIAESQLESEKIIKAEQMCHAYNERMASRRAKMRVLKLEFEGASIFSVVISLIFIFISVFNRSDAELKTLALPMWASLSLLPVITAVSFSAAIRNQPELYLVLAGLLVITALIAWGMASIVLVLAACAFVAFYLITRSVSEFRKEPEFPHYFDKNADDFI